MLALPAAAQTEVSTTYFMNSSTSRHDINPALLDKPYVSMPLLPLTPLCCVTNLIFCS